MVFFTADMHFGHRAIINMQNRPFESVEEMDRILLVNVNIKMSEKWKIKM